MTSPEYTLTTASIGLQGDYSLCTSRPTIWAYDPPFSIPLRKAGKTLGSANSDIYVQPFDLHGTAEEVLRQYIIHGMNLVAGMVAAGEDKDQETELVRLMALYPEVQRKA